MTVRMAILGCGRIGAMHASTLASHPEVDSLVIMDPDEKRSQALATRWGTSVCASVDHLLAAQPDAVVIAAPTASHPELVRRCLAEEIPTFCEKPLALDVPASRDLVEQANRSGVPLQVGFQRRFDSEYARARQAVASGELGQIYSVRMIGCDAEPPPPEFVPTSGGIFRDLHIHDFDALRWMTGREVLDIFALGTNREPGVLSRNGDFKGTAAVLRLTDDVLVTLVGDRYNAAGYDIRMELAGSHNTIAVGWGERAPVCPVGEIGVPRLGKRAYAGFLDRFGPAYAAELGAFVDLVQRRVPNPCPPVESLEALYIAEAALLSAQQGRPVTVAEIRGEGASAGDLAAGSDRASDER